MTLANQIAVMRGGHVMQFGSPDHIYNQPQALFVASFMGSPAMNLINAKRISRGLQLGDQLLAIPPERLAAADTRNLLTIGLRPENCRIHRHSQEDQQLQAQLVLLEPLGAETLATFSVQGQEITARLAADFRLPLGSQCPLYFDPVQLHMFDPDSGLAL